MFEMLDELSVLAGGPVIPLAQHMRAVCAYIVESEEWLDWNKSSLQDFSFTVT